MNKKKKVLFEIMCNWFAEHKLAEDDLINFTVMETSYSKEEIMLMLGYDKSELKG